MHLQPEKARKGGKGEGLLRAVGISSLEKHSTEPAVHFWCAVSTWSWYISALLVLCIAPSHVSQSHAIIHTTVAIVMASTVKLVLVTCAVMAYFVRQCSGIKTHTCSMARCRTLLVNIANSMQTYVPIFVAAATQNCPSLAVTWTLVTQTWLQSTRPLHSLHSNPTSSSQPWVWVQGPICIWHGT